MRKTILSLGVMLAFTGAALADGTGPVTKIKGDGGANPSCFQFQTNGGPTWYGFSLNPAVNPATELDQFVVGMNRMFQGAVSFQVGAPDPDCAAGGAIVGAYGFSY